MTQVTLHAQIDDLGSRLLRIGAHAGTLHDLTMGVHDGHTPAVLLDLLERAERDLMLTTQALELLRDRVQRENASLSALADRVGDDA